MSYTVTYSNPSKVNLIISPLQVNTTSTSLNLWGRGATNYGQLEQNNFVHMLENFANSTPPANPIEGQVWYDTGSTPHTLRAYNVTLGWVASSNIGTGPTSGIPVSPQVGDMWFDTTIIELLVCTSITPSVWSATSAISTSLPPSPTIGQLYFNTITSQLMVCTSISPITWTPVSLTQSGTIPPADPLLGQLWYNTGPDVLNYWNGTNWEVLAGSNNASAQPPVSPVLGQFWFDTSNQVMTFWNGTVWEIISVHQVDTAGIPTQGTPGQIIFNTDLQALEYWNGTQLAWLPLEMSVYSEFAPALPIVGQLWYNTTTSELQIWNGTAFISTAPVTTTVTDWTPGIVFG